MDRQLIKSLIDALESSGLSELEYASGGETLRLAKNGVAPALRPAPVHAPAQTPAHAPVQTPAPSVQPASPTPVIAEGGLVAAPLYGVVHLQPAPGAPAFVAVGQGVEPNQVLCTVEAMKVFTEVRAVRAGTVEAILVSDGQEVEPGQALVRVR